jgi:hypothetical protein
MGPPDRRERMTGAASEGVGQPHAVRVLAVRVRGEQLLLLGEVAERPTGAPDVPPSELVLLRRGSDDVVRIPLAADGPDAPLSAGIDVRPLLRDGVATWAVQVVDEAGRAIALEWDVGSAPGPAVVLRSGEDLVRGRVRGTKGGPTVVVDRLPPHAEV